MRSIEFKAPGGYEVLALVDRPIPKPANGQLLVKVTFAAVNAVDNTVRSGTLSNKYSPVVLGNEGVGIIVKGNIDLPVGKRVMISCFTANGQIRGIYVNGVWQEYLAVEPSELIPIEDNISDEEAAAFPVSFFSAQACLNKADFTPGKSVLALAAGGGVGNAGIQLAKAHGASTVITTVGSEKKAKMARALGIKNVIDLSIETITDGVARLTDGKGVDIVIDSVGGALTGEAIHSLARQGILVAIGYSAGRTFSANITDFVWKGIQMRGQSLNGWFDRVAENKVWDKIMPLFNKGQIKPVIAKVFRAEEVADAQRYLIEERPFGKVLIKF
ncbi:zinc-binding alcohol dehydrogenase family protein [Mucilaginibacter gynuensis]|uniref:Zinc-binding alcohol dehydrogenase family protein n=1 Tax=Mucilaginibacter gynuensis TaxID=1302236 RepID=A0ABP8G5Q8_9SPHI